MGKADAGREREIKEEFLEMSLPEGIPKKILFKWSGYEGKGLKLKIEGSRKATEGR